MSDEADKKKAQQVQEIIARHGLSDERLAELKKWADEDGMSFEDKVISFDRFTMPVMVDPSTLSPDERAQHEQYMHAYREASKGNFEPGRKLGLFSSAKD